MKQNESKKEIRNHVVGKVQGLMDLLMAQGVLEDTSIDNVERRKAQQARLEKLYHNTQILFSPYREIPWTLECFPETIAQELDKPFENLDTLLDRVDSEEGMGNKKLENLVEGVHKSRLFMDRIHDAPTVLKNNGLWPPAVTCPVDGELVTV